MIYWVPFLHFYQPPTQFHAILKKVCNESYRPLLEVLLEHPNAKVTVNICGILTEMLNDHGASDILTSLRELAENGQLEFVDSAKYHPILPLIPKKEMRRQIELNRKTNSHFFKKVYQPIGFFPPEMCYSDELAILLSEMAYSWALISGIACPEKWPQNVIYKAELGLNGISMFYRDDILSNKISFQGINSKDFIAELINLGKGKKDIYVITALDAETFGHHVKNWERLFLAETYKMIDGVRNYEDIKQKTNLAQTHREIFESEKIAQIKVVTVSELFEKFSVEDAGLPRPSSWSTTKEDMLKGDYYPLWKKQDNPVHTLQWEHLKVCFELVEQAADLKDNEMSMHFADIARGLLDRAMHSCQFWWANKKKGIWDINLINKGLILQEEVIFNAYKAIVVSQANEEIKRQLYHKLPQARDIASKIRDYLFVT